MESNNTWSFVTGFFQECHSFMIPPSLFSLLARCVFLKDFKDRILVCTDRCLNMVGSPALCRHCREWQCCVLGTHTHTHTRTHTHKATGHTHTHTHTHTYKANAGSSDLNLLQLIRHIQKKGQPVIGSHPGSCVRKVWCKCPQCLRWSRCLHLILPPVLSSLCSWQWEQGCPWLPGLLSQHLLEVLPLQGIGPWGRWVNVGSSVILLISSQSFAEAEKGSAINESFKCLGSLLQGWHGSEITWGPISILLNSQVLTIPF